MATEKEMQGTRGSWDEGVLNWGSNRFQDIYICVNVLTFFLH